MKIDLSNNSDNIILGVIDSAIKNFDFLTADEKLNVIKKTLHIDKAKWEASRKDLDIIRENIQIRNIFQHNHGIIKEEDLKYIGKAYFEEDCGNEIKKKKVGMKIKRTPYDIENCVDSMIYTANMII